MKHSSQAATTAAQSAENKRGSNCLSALPTPQSAENKRGSNCLSALPTPQSAENKRGSNCLSALPTGNELKYYVRNGCVVTANLFSAGALLQTFLTEKGLSGAQIGTVTASLNMVHMITILLFSAVVDKVRDSLKTSVAFLMFMPLFALAMLPISLMENVPANTVFTAVLIAGSLLNVVYGFYVILDYRIPYQIIDMRGYGRLTSLSGIVGGILMVAVSGLTTVLLYRCPSEKVFFGMYLLSAVCIVAAIPITRSMKTVNQPMTEENRKKVGLLNTLKMPAFWLLLTPNLMRGFNSGVLGMLATIGIHELSLSAAQSSVISIIYTAMTIVGPICFLRLQGKLKLHHLYLLGSAVMCCMLPLMLAGRSFGIYLAVYVVLLLGQGIADYSMPVLITRVIPYESIGSYTSLRMGIHTGGIALGAMAAGAALGRIPAIAILLLSGCLQLCSGTIYWLYCRRRKDDLY